MHLYQVTVFFNQYNNKNAEIPVISPLSVNEEWLEIQKKFKNEIPQEGTKFTEYEEIMKEISKWYLAQNPTFGFGASAAPALEKKEEVKSEKAEEKIITVIEL